MIMLAYVLIPKLAFDGQVDALRDRAKKSHSYYSCFQACADKVAVAFSCDDSAISFHWYCVAKGIRAEIKLMK
jgi:hypothetical protein